CTSPHYLCNCKQSFVVLVPDLISLRERHPYALSGSIIGMFGYLVVRWIRPAHRLPDQVKLFVVAIGAYLDTTQNIIAVFVFDLTLFPFQLAVFVVIMVRFKFKRL